jgi:HEAT repeat protein
MATDSFDGLSPTEQFRRLQDLERVEGRERSDRFCRLVEAFRESLRALPSEKIMELLAGAIGISPTEDEQSYWCCVGELHRRAEPIIFETCATWAASAERKSREASADILSQLGYPRAHPFARQSQAILEKLLQDAETGVVRAALFALGHLGIGELSGIVGHAQHPDAEVRRAVVHALLPRDEPLARQTLIELSRDAETEVRDWATFGLGAHSKVDSPEIRAALVARLTDADDETRGEALVGLAERKDPRVIPAIASELARDDVGALAIEAAGRMPHESLLPPLEALLRANPHDLHIIAAIAACRSIAPNTPKA